MQKGEDQPIASATPTPDTINVPVRSPKKPILDIKSFGLEEGTPMWKLVDAIMKGDQKTITTLLIQDSTLVNTPYHNNQLPLMLAIHFSNKPVIRLLLEQGADPNITALNDEKA